MSSKTPATVPIGLPRHLLEPFFHNKKVLFSVHPTDTRGRQYDRTGRLEVALHMDETPYLRVVEQGTGQSDGRTYHGTVQPSMLATMKWDEAKEAFYADWSVADFPSSP